MYKLDGERIQMPSIVWRQRWRFVADLVPEPASEVAEVREHAERSRPADAGRADASRAVVQRRADPARRGEDQGEPAPTPATARRRRRTTSTIVARQTGTGSEKPIGSRNRPRRRSPSQRRRGRSTRAAASSSRRTICSRPARRQSSTVWRSPESDEHGTTLFDASATCRHHGKTKNSRRPFWSMLSYFFWCFNWP